MKTKVKEVERASSAASGLKVVAAFSAILMVICAFSVVCAAESSDAEQTQSGVVGDCSWEIVDGTLFVTGNGDMPDFKFGHCGPWGKDITSVVISGGVSSIGANAFCGCEKLTSVVIGLSVVSIHENAFMLCTSLEKVFLPFSVRVVESNAFDSCFKLSEVTLSENLDVVGEFAFAECHALHSLQVPASASHVDSLAFHGVEEVKFV